eukprot:152824_1
MAQVQHDESLIPLIRICRALEVCTSDEIITFGSDFLKILSQHNNFLSRIKTVLCSVHSMLSTEIFDELLASLPNTNQEIDDSMALNILDDTESPLNSIIQIPKDLLIHTFQYLHTNDIYQIQKTCRLFCAIAHDPNSLWCLHLDLKHDTCSSDLPGIFAHYRHYHHTRYSRIKRLQFRHHHHGWDAQCTMMNALPQFTHIHALYLDNSNAEGDGDLILNKLNADDLLPYLHTLIIDRWSSRNICFQQLVYWILANGCDNKTLTILDSPDMYQVERHHVLELGLSGFFDSNLNTHGFKQLQEKALININTLRFHIYDFSLVNNISTWLSLCKHLKFDEFILDVMFMYTFGTDGKTSDESIQPMHNIVSRSVQSSFCWSPNYQYDINMMDKSHIKQLSRDSRKIRITKHKWILHDWPNTMTSHRLSNFQLFDNIILCLEIDVKGDVEAKELFESAIKPWIQLKRSVNTKSCVSYKLVADIPGWWFNRNPFLAMSVPFVHQIKSILSDYQDVQTQFVDQRMEISF